MIIIKWSGRWWTCNHGGKRRQLRGVAHGARSELIAARYRLIVDPDETNIVIDRHAGQFDGLTGKLIRKRWGAD